MTVMTAWRWFVSWMQTPTATRPLRCIVCVLVGWWAAALNFSLVAQTLKVTDIDTTDFPTMRAKVYVLNSQGRYTPIQQDQLSIVENGVPRPISKFSCSPPPSTSVPLSVVMTMDVSGSMHGVNLEIAKSAARALIEMLPNGSECAITSFDNANYINCDFTQDKKRLLAAVKSLKSQGGTDYDEGLTSAPFGALVVAKQARFKRVVVFLTDGLGNATEKTIVKQAQAVNASIYIVTVNLDAPDVLKSIAFRTGGEVVDNVTTPQQAVEAFQTVVQRAQGMKPCEIVWQSATPCDNIMNLTMKCRTPDLSTSLKYVVPSRSVATLEFSPSSFAFRSVPPGEFRDTMITITARNSRFAIRNIVSSDLRFRIFPVEFALEAGQSQRVKVTFTPNDSNFTFTQITALTDICNAGVCYAAGGFPGKEPSKPTLKVLKPNGGEVLLAGTDTVITWTGVLPQEKLIMEYSVDNGKSWRKIGKPASGLHTRWTVPGITSEQALVRVSQFPKWDKPVIGGQHGGKEATVAAYSPDNRYVLTAGADNIAALWDTTETDRLRGDPNDTAIARQVFVGHTDKITSAAWSPGGRRFLTASLDNTVRVWSVNASLLAVASTNASLALLNAASQAHTTATAHSTNGEQRVKTLRTVLPSQTLLGHSQPVVSALWSTDGTQILTASRDGTARIWNARTDEQPKLFAAHKEALTGAWWSPNERRIVTTSLDNTARVWDVETGEQKFVLQDHTGAVNQAAWSPDGKHIVTVSSDSTAIMWDAETGKRLRRYVGHAAPVRRIVFEPRGNRFATGGDDGVVCVWTAGEYSSPAMTEEQMQLWREMYPNSVLSRRLLLNDGTIWDNEPIDSLVGHIAPITHLAWDERSRRILSSSNDQSTCMWALERVEERGKIVYRYALMAAFEAASAVKTAMLSANGSRLVMATSDGTVLLWKTQSTPRQQDVSDNVFAIVAPQADADNVYLGEVIVGKARDSVFTGYIRNLGGYPVTVKSIEIQNVLPATMSALNAVTPVLPNKNIQEFSIVSGLPPFTIPPKGSKAVEFRFQPLMPGARGAGMNIITNADTLRRTIRGRGVMPPMLIANAVVDMGAMLVGKTKDTVLVAQLKNTSQEPLRILNVRQIGPNTTDFTTDLPKTFTISGLNQRNVTVRFKPSAVGRTSGGIAIDYVGGYSGLNEPVTVRFLGAGDVQKITVRGRVIDTAGRPLVASIKWEDLDSREKVGTTQTSTSGTYAFQLRSDRNYGYYFEKPGYFPISRHREFASTTSTVATRNLVGTTVFEPDVVLLSLDDIRRNGGILPMNNIFFDYNSAVLRPESFLELDRLVAALKANPTQRVEVAGHTDNSGSEDFNQILSRRRAEAVMAYLISRGCLVRNIVAKGYGASVPIADNATDEGRAKNRRVELRFLVK